MLPQTWRADLDNVLVSTAKAGMASALDGPFLTDPQGLSTNGPVLLAACRALLATALAPSASQPQHPLLGPILDIFRTGQQLLGTPVASFCSGALMATLPLLHPRALPPPSAALVSPEAAREWGAGGRHTAGTLGGERAGAGAPPVPNPRLCGVPAPLPPSPLSRATLQGTTGPDTGAGGTPWGGGEKRGERGPSAAAGARRAGAGAGPKLTGGPLAQVLQQQQQQESGKESTGSPGTSAAGLGATSAPALSGGVPGGPVGRHPLGQGYGQMPMSAGAGALAGSQPQPSLQGLQPSDGLLAAATSVKVPQTQSQPPRLGAPGAPLLSVPQEAAGLGSRQTGANLMLNNSSIKNSTAGGYADFGLYVSEKLDLANATMPLEIPAYQAGAQGLGPGVGRAGGAMAATAAAAAGASTAGGAASEGGRAAGSVGGGDGRAGGGGSAHGLLSSASGKQKARPTSSGTPSTSSKADLVFERTFAPAMAKFLVASSGGAAGSPSKSANTPGGAGAGPGGRKAAGTPPAKGAGSRGKGKLSQSQSQPQPQPQGQGQRIVRKLSMPAPGDAGPSRSQSQSQGFSQGQSESPGGKSEGNALERGAWVAGTDAGPGAWAGSGARAGAGAGAGPGAGAGSGADSGAEAGANGKKRNRPRRVARTAEEAEMAASLAAAEMEESRRKALKIASGLASRQRPAAGAPTQQPGGVPQAAGGAPQGALGNPGALGRPVTGQGQQGGSSQAEAVVHGGVNQAGGMPGGGHQLFGGEEGLPILSPTAVMAAMASLNEVGEDARFDALDSDSDGPMPEIHLD